MIKVMISQRCDYQNFRFFQFTPCEIFDVLVTSVLFIVAIPTATMHDIRDMSLSRLLSPILETDADRLLNSIC